MNHALRRRHRRIWAALVLLLAMLGVLAWRDAVVGRALGGQAAAGAVAPSPAPLGDAVP